VHGEFLTPLSADASASGFASMLLAAEKALWRYLQAVTLNTNLGSLKIELFCEQVS